MSCAAYLFKVFHISKKVYTAKNSNGNHPISLSYCKTDSIYMIHMEMS